ncbi:MAG: hypothetical protein AB1772_11160 [Candidatus Zixiibacteriota bacterium]
MSRTETLKSFEVVLESFLERAVSQKAGRLRVLDGISRLDDIARLCRRPEGIGRVELSDRIGDWFAGHYQWMEDSSLRPADRERIGRILGGIRNEIDRPEGKTPATEKIVAEIDRWQAEVAGKAPRSSRPPESRKLVLRKGPESAPGPASHPTGEDSIGQFSETMKTMAVRFEESSRGRAHLMSVLGDSLSSAALQKNREALLLSAMIIYYLKQNGYMVEPFVKRLKEAERMQREVGSDA